MCARDKRQYRGTKKGAKKERCQQKTYELGIGDGGGDASAQVLEDLGLLRRALLGLDGDKVVKLAL